RPAELCPAPALPELAVLCDSCRQGYVDEPDGRDRPYGQDGSWRSGCGPQRPDLPSRMVRLLAACCALIPTLAAAQDTLYTNATIYTADDDTPRASAMLVRDGRIAAIAPAGARTVLNL